MEELDILCPDCNVRYQKLDETHGVCPKCGDLIEFDDDNAYAVDGYRINDPYDFHDSDYYDNI